MRKSEITNELIQLSKSAKELGFPQDVQEGDWYGITDNLNKSSIFLCGPHIGNFNAKKQKGAFLILSFSICLAWLKSKAGVHELYLSFYNPLREVELEYSDKQGGKNGACGKSHHEAITKAVVKVLEERKK